jgi:Zn-dependent alcohol dehydrogenase
MFCHAPTVSTRCDNYCMRMATYPQPSVASYATGNIFGGGSSHVETPKLVGLYKSGQLKIDEMVTTTYSLENINDGYADMLDGKNIRGVIKFTESDW